MIESTKLFAANYGSELVNVFTDEMPTKIPTEWHDSMYTNGYGFETFNKAKRFLGSPGIGKQWHHIVEQSQIEKSGFSPVAIHNTSNLISIDKDIHNKISGHYNTTTFYYTNGLSVRNWLAGQSFETQYNYGIKQLKDYGVIK